MEQEAVYFRENSIIKSAFHKNKGPININEVDIERIKLSNKKSYGKDSFKYFIGYRHEGNAFPSPLFIKLPQMNVYTKYFDKNSKYMNYLVKDEKILNKYLKYGMKLKVWLKEEVKNNEDKLLDGETKVFKLLTDLKYEKHNALNDIAVLESKLI